MANVLPWREASEGQQPDRRLAVFDALPDASVLVDGGGRITHVNAAWATFSALNQGETEATGVGAGYLDVCRAGAEAGDADAATVASGLEGVLSGRLRAFEHRYPCPSPIEDRWFIVRITPLADGDGALVCHLDVTASKLAEERLAYRATHDPLTGLPNRDQVLDHLRTAIARLDRSGIPIAVLFLDLDRFKPINDRYGHATGDRLLVLVANRLRRQIRATDIVGRVGGDEFVAVGEAAGASALAARLRHAVSSPIQLGADTVSVGVSIGVALLDRPAAGAPDEVAIGLLGQADAAMYEDKQRRRRER